MKTNKNKYEELTQDEKELFLYNLNNDFKDTILQDYIIHLLDCILKLARNNRELLKENMYLENELRKMRKGIKTRKWKVKWKKHYKE